MYKTIRLFNKTLLGYQSHQVVYLPFNHLMWLVAQEFTCHSITMKAPDYKSDYLYDFHPLHWPHMPKILSKSEAMSQLATFPYSGTVNLQLTFIQPPCWRIPSLSTAYDCFCLYLEATSIRYHRTWCQRVH